MRIAALFLLAVGCGASAHAPVAAPPAPSVVVPSVPWIVTGGPTPEDDMLHLINAYRVAAGVRPVPLDPALTKGCREHAAYMVINRGTPQLYSTNAHRQDPMLPGATPDGAACGINAVLYPNIEGLQTAVHGWMSSLFHRRGIIAPDLVALGIGHAPLPAGNRMAIALRFVFGVIDPSAFPIPFPANDQIDVPVDFVREEPNPIPPPTVFAGYPITLHFPFYDPLTNVSAMLVDGTGAPVPFFLSSPEQPASKYTSQGANVGIIPKEPLRAGMRYTVTANATWGGRSGTRTWSFTTMARQTIDSNNGPALDAAIGRPALVRGAIVSATKVTEGSAQLALTPPPRGFGRINKVVVDVTIPEMKIDPAKFSEVRGMKVEVEATPRLLYDSIYLAVTPVSAFRMTP